MPKKIKVEHCYWCPHRYKKNSSDLYCSLGDRLIPKLEIEERDKYGVLNRYKTPDWCPLEDY